MFRRSAILIRGLLLAFLLGCNLGHAQQPPSEAQLKAVFLYKFGNFIEWPPGFLSSSNGPLIIGVIGNEPFKGELERIVRDKTINGHPVIVSQTNTPEEIKNCHILFITAGGENRMKEIMESVKGSNILTVGETGQFIAQGGMINFVLEDNRIRFQINTAAAEHAGLKISSKLLALAKPLGK